ncbi:hypothetical protein BGZ94_002807 [Podila epigama]|nr:hypothetical protein BGZ94_002807 [Podila epigama]
MIKNITTGKEYYSTLKSNRKVAVQWSVIWCRHSRRIATIFQDYCKTYTDITFASIDADDVPEVSEEVQLMLTPTFQFFVNGEKVEELIGANAELLGECLQRLSLEK